MTTIKTLLITASAAALAACAQTDSAEVEAQEVAVEAPANDDAPMRAEPATLAEATEGASDVAMWRVGDEDTTVYMIGTVHVLAPGTAWATDRFDAAFEGADGIFLEADALSPESQARMAELIPQLAMNPPGVTLSSYFTAEEQAELNEVLAPMGVQLAQLDAFRPWFAGLQLGVAAIVKAGGSPEAGVEMMIASRAAEAGKEMRYLETVEEQLTLLASADDQRQADYMVSDLDTFEDAEGYFARMVGAWYDGEPDRVGEMMNESFEGYPEIADALLYQRNANWAEQIEELIETEEGTYLVAVGAGHLAGEKTVQDYLEERGYEADRY